MYNEGKICLQFQFNEFKMAIVYYLPNKMIVLGVIGYPIKHSLSPLIHNAWLKESGIDGVYQYIPVENQENLEKVFEILPSMGYLGINVTLPYKTAVFEIAQKHGFEISNDALETGSVNTINFAKKRALNTDIYGFKQMCKASEDTQVLVIGAGGVASSVIYALQGSNITITNRTQEKAGMLAEKFMCDVYHGELSKLDLTNFDIVINTTSLGIKGEVIHLNYKTLQNYTKCFDLIYKPKVTPFLDRAKKQGCKVENGAIMLIEQAAKAFEDWTNIKPHIGIAKNVMRDFII